MTDDNVVNLPIGERDPAVLRAIVLASQRLVRAHPQEFRRYLTDELRRSGNNKPGGAA